MWLPRDWRDWNKSSVDIVLRPSRLHFLAMSKVIVMMKSVVTFWMHCLAGNCQIAKGRVLDEMLTFFWNLDKISRKYVSYHILQGAGDIGERQVSFSLRVVVSLETLTMRASLEGFGARVCETAVKPSKSNEWTRESDLELWAPWSWMWSKSSFVHSWLTPFLTPGPTLAPESDDGCTWVICSAQLLNVLCFFLEMWLWRLSLMWLSKLRLRQMASSARG